MVGLDQDFSAQQTAPKNSISSNAELIASIKELNKSLNHMLKIFEDANQEIIDEYQGSRLKIKEKLDEISDQNEKIARGLVGLADMIKRPETPKKEDDLGLAEPASQDYPEEQALPELEIPSDGLEQQHEFDMGYDEDQLQEATFNNQHGISQRQNQQQQRPVEQQMPIQKQQIEKNYDLSELPDFGADSFSAQDPFEQEQQVIPENSSQPNNFGQQQFGQQQELPEMEFEPPKMPNKQPFPRNEFAAQPNFGQQQQFQGRQYPQQYRQQPAQMHQMADEFPPPPDFLQQPMNQQGGFQNLPPDVPEPPKKKGLFGILKK